MNYTERKLLTVVSEAALESRLIKDVMEFGAKGYTVTSAHGTGPRNQRNGDLEGGNIRLEVVAKEEVVLEIAKRIGEKYFPHYALSLWVSDVRVLRDERY
jgi:nitrogen regulatory protein P-II 2